MIKKLINLSRQKEIDYHSFFDWENYNLDADQRFMDETLISLYGLPIYDTLSEKQKKELSKLEVAQIIYCYAQSETIMCQFMGNHLVELPFASDNFTFLIREQIEEYRHQDMFIRALDLLGHTYLPITGFLRWQAKLSAKYLSAKRFFLLQIIVELISDDFGKMCYENSSVNKLVQDVSKFHHLEESRHIAFARNYLDKTLCNLNFFERTFGGIIMAVDIYFMNAGYIREEFYQKIGLSNTKKLYKEAMQNYKKNAKKNFNSPDGKAIIEKYQLVTWANKRCVHLLTGLGNE